MIYIGAFLCYLSVSLIFCFCIVIANLDHFVGYSIRDHVLCILVSSIVITLIFYVPSALIYTGATLL